jgi:cytochrome c1
MRVLSQGEIDGLLKGMLKDSSVLPTESESAATANTPAFSDAGEAAPDGPFADFPGLAAKFAPPPHPVEESDNGEAVPPGIAAFRAKIAAMQAAKQQENESAP